jgi:hypothetical protein
MKIAFDGVTYDDQRGQWCATLVVTDDAGVATRVAHVFPLDAMEWRAAEYGIDPADTATLLDIVLAEPHLTPEDLASGWRLHDAPDIATARRDHIARCAAAKLRVRMSTRAKGSPLDRVRAESVLHPEVIEAKAELVAQVRAREAAKRAPTARGAAAVGSGAERAARLRAQMFAPQPTPKDEES